MSPGGAVAAVFSIVALVAYVVWTYRRRELPVRGRGVPAALRAAALVLVLLLLFDPALPGGAVPGDAATRLLLDGSLSMGVGPDSSWRRAREEVAGRGDLPVVVFGDERARSAASQDVPVLTSTLLTPALERAAEAGARRVVVVSDLRLEDAGEAAAAARRLGLDMEVVDVGREVRDAAVHSFTVPAAVGAGEAVSAEVAVAATAAAAGDSATVEVREGERLVASRPVVLPDPGRRALLRLELPPPAGDGAVPYRASVVLDGDAWPDDDARLAWTDVDPEEGSAVLVGVTADWEPRFLLPVLGRVTGLRTRGLLRLGPDRWLVMDESGAGGTVDDARAAREARGAVVLVVQGGGADAPSWLGDAVEGARRLLVLASTPADAALAGVDAGPPLPGEWYASPDVPPSPLAAELSGAPVEGLPPLGPLLPLRDTAGAVVPLHLRRGAGGAPEAALTLRRTPEGRRAVALAPGWWRWPFRSPEGRDAYRRLWAGVAGWLLADETAAGPGLRPATRVVSRGRPVEWSAGGAAGDSLSLTMTRGDTTVLDTTLAVPPSGRLATPPLPPGRYAWRGSWPEAGAVASGELDVEAWTAELLHPRATDLARDPGDGSGAPTAAGAGRSLRTHPLPWLLVLALLSAEWVLRRRRGLR